ncbi:MAG: glycosyltransferase family 9 protein, partial [Chthoniobacterales bacterium]
MNPKHLLVLKPSSLGDVVHTLPAVSALRAKFPGARITWMVSDEWAPLLEGNPDINDLLIFPRRDFRGPLGPLRFMRWRSTLPSKLSPDLILDFQGLLRTGLTAQAFKGVPVYGLSDAREGARFFQTQTVRVTNGMHAVERYLALAAAVGATLEGAPKFQLPEGKAPDAVLPHEPWILLHPFSRGRGKSLSPEAVLAFCREANMPVVLAGRSDAAFSSLPASVVNLLNKTSLLELIWLLRRAAFVVSVDSGPMHLAAGVTDKLIGIHTWSDPCKVGPYRAGATVWKGGEFFPA